MAGVGQQSKLMTYAVHLSEHEGEIAAGVKEMVNRYGSLNKDNILKFLHEFGKYCDSQGVPYEQAMKRLWAVMRQDIKADLEETFSQGGPVKTATAAQAEMKYMGGEWTAIEQSAVRFAVGYEPPLAQSRPKKWCRTSMFGKVGTGRVTPERQYLTPGTPATAAKALLEADQAHFDSVRSDLSQVFRGASEQEVQVVVASRNSGVVDDIGEEGKEQPKVARPAIEQRYLALCAAWAAALGVTGAVWTLQTKIMSVMYNKTMAWSVVGKTLDKLREQVAMAHLVDAWRGIEEIQDRWNFVSQWRVREQGAAYIEHEALLARALLAKAPRRLMQKATDAGIIRGSVGIRDYTTLRRYMRKAHEADMRLDTHKPPGMMMENLINAIGQGNQYGYPQSLQTPPGGLFTRSEPQQFTRSETQQPQTPSGGQFTRGEPQQFTRSETQPLQTTTRRAIHAK